MKSRLWLWWVTFLAFGMACQTLGNVIPLSASAPSLGENIPTPILGPGASQVSIPPPGVAATPTRPVPGGGLATIAPPATGPVTPTVLQGTPVTCPGTNLRLTLPQGLNLKLSCLSTAFQVFDNPKSIQIWRFAVDHSDPFCQQGCIDLIPLAQATQAFGQWRFPPYNAGVVFSARQKVLTFSGGRGTRTLEIQGQTSVMANNQDLRYIVRGYDNTNQWSVYVDLPIDAAVLPSHPDPNQNTNPQAYQPLPASDNPVSIEAYNLAVVPVVEQLATSHFTPRLDLLDQLVQSLVVK